MRGEATFGEGYQVDLRHPYNTQMSIEDGFTIAITCCTTYKTGLHTNTVLPMLKLFSARTVADLDDG